MTSSFQVQDNFIMLSANMISSLQVQTQPHHSNMTSSLQNQTHNLDTLKTKTNHSSGIKTQPHHSIYEHELKSHQKDCSRRFRQFPTQSLIPPKVNK